MSSSKPTHGLSASDFEAQTAATLTEIETQLLVGQLDFLRDDARLIWMEAQRVPDPGYLPMLAERSRDVSNALLSALRIFGVRGLPEPLVLNSAKR